MICAIPPLPHSWSELTWEQLTQMWTIKIRYGGHPEVARVAALLSLCGLSSCRDDDILESQYSKMTGESVYALRGGDGRVWTATAREVSHLAKQALRWFDYPYGDQGEKEEHDADGKVTKARREPVAGYVSPMRDAMILPEDRIKVKGSRFKMPRWFKLPEVACNNLTWQQYRTLQNITPQLFSENIEAEQAIELQARFLSHILTPRSFALLDTNGSSIRLHLHYVYEYNEDRSEGIVSFWKKRLQTIKGATIFHVCFQVYQTALSYYSASYPLLFSGGGKNETMKDALTGEVGTINTIMKYAGYAEQQQVYDSNLPFVLDILNTMSKEAKEIEKMNAKIKKK